MVCSEMTRRDSSRGRVLDTCRRSRLVQLAWRALQVLPTSRISLYCDLFQQLVIWQAQGVTKSLDVGVRRDHSPALDSRYIALSHPRMKGEFGLVPAMTTSFVFEPCHAEHYTKGGNRKDTLYDCRSIFICGFEDSMIVS